MIFFSDSDGPNDGGADQDPVVDKGNTLILQSHASPTQTVPGCLDTLNDDENAGSVDILFDQPLFTKSIERIAINGQGMLTISLLIGSDLTRV